MMPLDHLNRRLIVGTWHTDAAFAETRQRLEGLEDGPPEHWWPEVLDLHHA